MKALRKGAALLVILLIGMLVVAAVGSPKLAAVAFLGLIALWLFVELVRTGVRAMLTILAFILVVGLLILILVKGAPEATRVFVLTVHEQIDAGTADYLRRAFQQAAYEQAVLIVIRLDTWGGYIAAMDQIVGLITSSEIPVLVLVDGKAYSAGAFIAEAAHYLCMQPGAVIGAAAPVGGDTKLRNALITRMRALAESRQRNVTACSLMVEESASYTAEEAVRLRVADAIVGSLEEAVASWGISEPQFVEIEKDSRAHIISLLSEPILAILLIVAAAIMIIFDLHHPTVILTAVAAIVGTLGFLGLTWALGAAVYEAVLLVVLIIAGIVLIILELKLPGGVSATAGAILIAIGAYLLLSREPYVYHVATIVVFTAAVVSASITALVIIHRIRRVLTKPLAITLERLIGKRGYVRRPIAPGSPGVVVVEAEEWTAIADEEIPEGARIEVVAVEGLRVKVRRVEET
ncbi:nodulation protein NfeD [archaeon]|nr:nodulation protein NfeD [archaeon]